MDGQVDDGQMGRGPDMNKVLMGGGKVPPRMDRRETSEPRAQHIKQTRVGLRSNSRYRYITHELEGIVINLGPLGLMA